MCPAASPNCGIGTRVTISSAEASIAGNSIAARPVSTERVAHGLPMIALLSTRRKSHTNMGTPPTTMSKSVLTIGLDLTDAHSQSEPIESKVSLLSTASSHFVKRQEDSLASYDAFRLRGQLHDSLDAPVEGHKEGRDDEGAHQSFICGLRTKLVDGVEDHRHAEGPSQD